MYTAQNYTEEIIKNVTWRKCFSPANLEKLLDFLIDKQWIPSQVTINRALTQLQFARTDGGSARKDMQAEINAAQRNLDGVIAETAAPPLTRSEVEYFSSLSFAELQRKYWGNDNSDVNTFAVRYRKAAAEHGFRILARPTIVEVEDEDKGDAIPLDAKTYHAMPAQIVCRRLQTDSRFKAAVNKLIAKGLI